MKPKTGYTRIWLVALLALLALVACQAGPSTVDPTPILPAETAVPPTETAADPTPTPFDVGFDPAELPRPEPGGLILAYHEDDCTVISLRPSGQPVGVGPCRSEFGFFDFAEATPQAAEDFAAFTAAYAPFEAQTPAGYLIFNGTGQTVANPAEQRIIANWARFVANAAPTGEADLEAQIALTWHREGGVAGFCDNLTVYRTGLVQAFRACDPLALTPIGRSYLAGDEATQLFDWLDAYAPARFERADDATADSMLEQVTFAGLGEQPLDDAAQVAILDFAGRLYLEAVPAASSLCPDLARPALVIFDGERYLLTDPAGGEVCPLDFLTDVFGQVQVVGQDLYYPTLGTDTAVLMRSVAGGAPQPLEFTRVNGRGVFISRFTVAPTAGSGLIAWSAVTQGDSGSVSDVWVADVGGDNRQQLVEARVAPEASFVWDPIRFSEDRQTLYLAEQPHGVGGAWPNFVGRYHALYAFDLASGEQTLLFDCGALDGFLCIGDFTDDLIAYTAAGEVRLVTHDGEEGPAYAPAQTDFVGYPTFNSEGELLFYAATLVEADFPTPVPGATYHVAPPYVGQAAVIHEADGVMLPSFWLDARRWVGGYVDGEVWGTAVYGLDGSLQPIEPFGAQAITAVSPAD